MSYDTKCHELAESFLDDLPFHVRTETVEKLAQTIQDTIEDFLGDVEADRELELECLRDQEIDRKIDERRLGDAGSRD